VLRFSYFRTRDGERWVFSGQLSRPWIDSLRSMWRCFRYRAPRGHVVVGLKDVTAVDTVGALLLADLQKAGVDLTETGLEENTTESGGARRG
jgi:hypothetical protein